MTRVQNELAAGTSAAQTGRSSALEGPGRSSQAAGRGLPPSSDEIRISSLTGQIVELAGLQSARRAERVEALSKSYGLGRYTVDPQQLSRSMVDEWLASGSK